MSPEEQLVLIWRHTHSDYKGKIDGVRCFLVLRPGGTQLVPFDGLTDAEKLEKLNYACRREDQNRRKKAFKSPLGVRLRDEISEQS